MRLLISFLSGLLCALPLLWDSLGFLSWVAAVPFLCVILTAEKPRYRDGVLFSLGYYGCLYHWFLYLYPLDFAGLNSLESVAVIAVAWIGLTLLAGLEMALLPVIVRITNCKNCKYAAIVTPPVIGAAFCLLEWGQTQTWLGVPYFRLALSQTGCLPMLQSASLFGSLFTGFLIITVNGYLSQALLAYRRKMPAYRRLAVIGVCLISLNFAGGAISLACRNKPEENVRVACIQGNILSGEKWSGMTASVMLDRYLTLSEQAMTEADAELIVWPETALNIPLNRKPDTMRRIEDFARRNEVTLFVGAFFLPASGDVYNAIYCFYPDGTVGQTPYCKQHLVPFGEYLPIPEIIRFLIPPLAELNLFADPLTPGTDATVQSTQWGGAGGLICFDSIYETLSLHAVQNGAEIIVLSTNDSWYRDSAGVYQHNRHAVLRAVETGRYIARAANTGISSIISPDGSVQSSLAPLVEGYITGDVAFLQTRTLYSYIGNTFVLVCGLLCLTCTALCRVRRKRDPEPPQTSFPN